MTTARRLTRSYIGSALGMLGEALVALGDRVLRIESDAHLTARTRLQEHT